jgi:hypothetical protein
MYLPLHLDLLVFLAAGYFGGRVHGWLRRRDPKD